MTATTTEVGFADKFKSAVALIERAVGLKIIKTAEQFEAARADHSALIKAEKDLDAEYNALPFVILAKEAQAIKIDLAAKLKAAKTGLKNGPMLAYEEAEKAKLRAEEERLAAIARAEAAKETARLVAEQKKAFDAAEKVRKAAEKKGDEEAARIAAEAADQARINAAQIKEDAAMAPAPVVVLESTTPTVARRMIKKWRLTTDIGAVYTSEDFKKTVRLPASELTKLDPKYFMLNHVAVSGVVDSLGKNAAIPGVLEVWEVPA